MGQFIVCKVFQCPFNGEGNCLNRVVSVNENGVCKRLTKEGWNIPVEDEYKVKIEIQEGEIDNGSDGSEE